jgi:hypothetical protein
VSSTNISMLVYYSVCLILLTAVTTSLALNAALKGISVTRVGSAADAALVDVGDLWESDCNKLLVFGTYAADFNAIEYLQRLKHYGPRLKRDASVDKIILLLNASPAACSKLLDLVSLSTDEVEVYADPTGLAGRAFKVSRGWRPDDKDLNPYLKLWVSEVTREKRRQKSDEKRSDEKRNDEK